MLVVLYVSGVGFARPTILVNPVRASVCQSDGTSPQQQRRVRQLASRDVRGQD